MTVRLPAGIGDIAWVMMKLQSFLGDRKVNLQVSAEGPARGLEFAELYPCVDKVEYYAMGYQQLHRTRHPDDQPLEYQTKRVVNLTANSHLELGNHISEYLPMYETKYDLWNLDIKQEYKEEYKSLVKPNGDFLIGIYPSSYKTNSNWNCGDPKIWKERIEQMHRYFDHQFSGSSRNVKFVLIGAKFDRRMAGAIMRLVHSTKIPIVNTVGRFHIASTIEMIQNLNVLVSFPSGIGIIGSMVGTPTVMLMPEHLKPMEYQWVPRKVVESKRFIQMQISDIEQIIHVACHELDWEPK